MIKPSVDNILLQLRHKDKETVALTIYSLRSAEMIETFNDSELYQVLKELRDLSNKFTSTRYEYDTDNQGVFHFRSYHYIPFIDCFHIKNKHSQWVYDNRLSKMSLRSRFNLVVRKMCNILDKMFNDPKTYKL